MPLQTAGPSLRSARQVCSACVSRSTRLNSFDKFLKQKKSPAEAGDYKTLKLETGNSSTLSTPGSSALPVLCSTGRLAHSSVSVLFSLHGPVAGPRRVIRHRLELSRRPGRWELRPHPVWLFPPASSISRPKE